MATTKRLRIQKLIVKIENAERLYDRSMRMAKKYSDKIRAMSLLLSKLENK
jgi:hypothetical protein